MKEESHLKNRYASKLIYAYLSDEDDTTVGDIIDFVDVGLSPKDVYNIVKFINNNLNRDGVNKSDCNSVGQMWLDEDSNNIPPIFYFQDEFMLENKVNAIEKCESDWILDSFYTLEYLKHLEWDYSIKVDKYLNPEDYQNNDSDENDEFDDNKYKLGYDDDILETRRDQWGNLYTKGGQMWEDYMNRNNDDDD